MNDLRMTCVSPSLLFNEGKRSHRTEGGHPLAPNFGQSPVTMDRTSTRIRSSFTSSYRFSDGVNLIQIMNARDTGIRRQIGETRNQSRDILSLLTLSIIINNTERLSFSNYSQLITIDYNTT